MVSSTAASGQDDEKPRSSSIPAGTADYAFASELMSLGAQADEVGLIFYSTCNVGVWRQFGRLAFNLESMP